MNTVVSLSLDHVSVASCHLLMLRCSRLHILYSWPQIPVCFPTLWVTVNFVEIWKEGNNDKNTKCTKRPQPLLLRVQLEPSLNALLVGLLFPKLSHPGGCWRFGGDSCLTEHHSGEMALCLRESKRLSQVSFIQRIWEDYSLWTVDQANVSLKMFCSTMVLHSLTVAQSTYSNRDPLNKESSWSSPSLKLSIIMKFPPLLFFFVFVLVSLEIVIFKSARLRIFLCHPSFHSEM